MPPSGGLLEYIYTLTGRRLTDRIEDYCTEKMIFTRRSGFFLPNNDRG